MKFAGARPLFVDTGAFYARFDANAPRHDRAATVFGDIGRGEIPYRPVHTSTYVLDERPTLVLSHRDNATAAEALEHVRASGIVIVHPDETNFDDACDRFERYDDQELSFTDHTSGVLASERDVRHVFTFDPTTPARSASLRSRTTPLTRELEPSMPSGRAGSRDGPLADCFLPGPTYRRP